MSKAGRSSLLLIQWMIYDAFLSWCLPTPYFCLQDDGKMRQTGKWNLVFDLTELQEVWLFFLSTLMKCMGAVWVHGWALRQYVQNGCSQSCLAVTKKTLLTPEKTWALWSLKRVQVCMRLVLCSVSTPSQRDSVCLAVMERHFILG